MQRIFASKGISVVRQLDNGQPFQSTEVIRVETRFCSKTHNTRVAAGKWNYGTIQQMHERSHTGQTRGRKINARCSHNFYSVLPSEPTYDNKDKSTCSYAPGTRDPKLPMDTYCDDVVDREQVVNTKSKTVSRDTCAQENRLKGGDRVVMMQKKKNKLTTVIYLTPLTVTNTKGSMITAGTNDCSVTRDASKFRKLYGKTSLNGTMGRWCDTRSRKCYKRAIRPR